MAYYECSKPSKKYSIRCDYLFRTYNTSNGAERHHYLQLCIDGKEVANSGIFMWDLNPATVSVGYELST